MIRFVSFNIRCDYGQDGINCFSYRKDLIKKKLDKENPDIICFQEVLPHVADWLREELTDYYVLGCGRSHKLDDEQETIAFKKERFNLISMDTFWMSETPYCPGSRYKEQSECPRTTTEVVLFDKEEREIYRVLNTHLDHVSSLARKLGLAQIMKRLEEVETIPGALTILAGDFNAIPGAEELKEIEGSGEFFDALEGIGGTFHDYGQCVPAEKIDYIYLKKPLKANAPLLWTDCRDGVYLSDHYPVSVEIYRS